MTETREKLATIGYSRIYTIKEDRSAFFFEGGMTIDADGAYRAYHPKKGKGLDYLANAGEPGNWWALVTDTGKKTGNPLIQKKTDPAEGFYISATSLQDATKHRTDPTRYVDSESIPFLVLPGNQTFGARLGDFGVALNVKTGALCGCLFADSGPKNKIGEGSIALADALGIPSSPKNGGVGNGIVYVVFPGSKTSWPLSASTIKTAGEVAFKKWGGKTRLKRVLPEASFP